MSGSFRTVADRLRDHARDFPGKAALIHPAGRLTFAELEFDTEAVAAGLVRAGLRPGDRTIVMMPVGADLAVLVLGLLKAGGVPIIVDPGMGLRRMLHCYRMVGAQAFVGVPVMHLLRRLRPRTFATVRTTVTTGRRWPWAAWSLRELARVAGRRGSFRPGPGDLVMISFTTGSTGAAKGVEFTYGSLEATVRAATGSHGLTAADVCLVTSLPFMFLQLLTGATSVLPAIDFRRVARADPAVVAATVAEHGVTALFASPALLGPLARHLSVSGGSVPAAAGRRLASLRCVVSGGAPVSAGLVAALRGVIAEEGRVYATYGATEATPIASIESRELLRPGVRAAVESGAGVCVGAPIDGMALRVVRVADTTPLSCIDVPVGEIGEIVVSGPVVSRRYLAPPDANTTMKITEDGTLWHRTGDVGRLDEHGRVWFCGRRADIVATAAGPLYPVPCESILDVHEDVLRTAIVPAPGADAAAVVCVELQPGVAAGDFGRIAGELRELAAAHEVTRGLTEFVRHPGFPVDVRHNAKIDRAALASRLASSRPRRPRRD